TSVRACDAKTQSRLSTAQTIPFARRPARWRRGWSLRRALCLAITVLSGSPTLSLGGTKNWVHGYLLGEWSRSNNWSPSGEPGGGDDAFFPTPIPVGDPFVSLSNGEDVGTLTFNDSYSLSGGTLTFGAGGGTVFT